MNVLKHFLARRSAFPVRRFSSSFKESLIEDFPYKFKNIDTLFPTQGLEHEGEFQRIYDLVSDMQLTDGFTFAYRALLESIVDRDTESMKEMLEPTIRSDFLEELNNLESNEVQLELINEQNATFKCELYDLRIIIGASVSRTENKANRLGEFNFPGVRGSKLINVYMADLQHVQNMRKLEMNLEVIAKLRTNLKLNAIDKSGNALIP